jgi:AsmA protein
MIETSGKVSMKDLKLAKNGKPAKRPAEAEFNVTHENASRRGTIRGGKLRLGSAEAALGGTYDLSGREPAVNLKLTGANMPLTELAAFLPALDVELPAGSNIETGTANVDIAAQGPLSRLTSTATIRADKARLANFDLGAKMRVLAQLAGLPTKPSTDIELLTTDVRTTPDGTTVNGLKLVVPSIGQMTGQGTISPQHALNFRMLATLATSGSVKELLGQNIPFTIEGTSAAPSFKADLKGVAGQKIQQAIRNPEGAAKTVTGIIDMFKRGSKKEQK